MFITKIERFHNCDLFLDGGSRIYQFFLGINPNAKKKPFVLIQVSFVRGNEVSSQSIFTESYSDRLSCGKAILHRARTIVSHSGLTPSEIRRQFPKHLW